MTTTFYSDPSDGLVFTSNATFATAHGAASGTVSNTSATEFMAYDKFDGTNYRVYRCFFSFDTSSIPVGAIIDSATFSVWAADVSNNNGALALQQGTQASGTALASTDFPAFNATELASRVANGFSSGAYVDFPLNTAGKAAINPGGYTKFCLKYGADIDNTPGSGTSYIGMAMAETTGTANDPKLVVTYHLPLSIPNTIVLTAVPRASFY